jgi:molybdopterin biosynthesis enzyme
MLSRRNAAGRVLAETVHSTLELPTHDVSAMDGYAVS